MKPKEPSYDWRADPLLGRQFFNKNRSTFPPDDLRPYLGQTVAWFPDGSGIREAGPDLDAVWEKIEQTGEDPSVYVYENLPPLDHTFV
jgi:hypothetical protein